MMLLSFEKSVSQSFCFVIFTATSIFQEELSVRKVACSRPPLSESLIEFECWVQTKDRNGFPHVLTEAEHHDAAFSSNKLSCLRKYIQLLSRTLKALKT